MFNKNIIHFSELISTNDYAISLKGSTYFKSGLVISTDYQTKGKGQRTNSWESMRGKNLLFSVVIDVDILLNKQFEINKFISVSIIEFLESLGVYAKIKWPNDILVDNKKIAGVLIENIVAGDSISYSIVGVGLNVNQINFMPFLPKAVSLKNIFSEEFDLLELRERLLYFLGLNFEKFKSEISFKEKYLACLYRYNKLVFFERNTKQFNGIIKGVNSKGLLIVKTETGRKTFSLKEIKILF